MEYVAKFKKKRTSWAIFREKTPFDLKALKEAYTIPLLSQQNHFLKFRSCLFY